MFAKTLKNARLRIFGGKGYAEGEYTAFGETKRVRCPLTLPQYADIADGVAHEVVWVERGEDYYAGGHVENKGKVPVFLHRDDWLRGEEVND